MIDYYLVMKPGIIFGNLVTLAAGFLLASKGNIHLALFFATLVGLGLIIASACVLNNYIDRYLDTKMERTKERALAVGRIKTRDAIAFAILLAAIGNTILYAYTNGLTVAVANVGYIVYVCLYSFVKAHTTYSTLIGSISGAVPPVVGYCAVSNQLDTAAGILFAIMIFWQMPHFFAIALWHYDDYKKAGIPVLPVAKGILRTKVHMALYILALIPIVGLLTYFGYTGYVFLAATTLVGFVWLVASVRGFDAKNDAQWGKQMFRLSLLMINAICFIIPFDIG